MTADLSPRWLATGGAVLLAGVIGIALFLQNGGSACAAPPSGGTVRTGKATFYDLGGGTGNCSFASVPADGLFVALGKSDYSEAGACGSYLDVTGPKGKVRVKVTDSCPECAPGHLDLSRAAFKKIADEVQGLVPITFKAVVSAPTPGRLSVRFKDGTSQWWFAVLIDNHANPLTSVQVKTQGGALRSAKRFDYNYWIIDGGAGPGPFSITMTDVYGHKATATGIKLLPEQTQTTGVRLSSGGVAAAPAPKVTKKAAPKTSSASPSASASASASGSASASVAPLVSSTTAPGAATTPPAEPPVTLAAATGSC